MAQIQVGSELNYNVRQPTTFLFQISATRTGHQHVVNDELSFDPRLEVEHCQVGLEGNRMQRVLVQPCQLAVRYQATVDLTPADRP